MTAIETSIAAMPTGPQGEQGEQGIPGEIPEAPNDGKRYVRMNDSWVTIEDIFALWLVDNPGGTPGEFLDSLLAGTAVGGAGIVFNQPTAAGANVMLDIPRAASGVFMNSAGGDDAINGRLILTRGNFTQGPTGHTSYWDTVMSLGLNMTGNTTVENQTMPSARIAIESKFAQGGATDPFLTEFHMGSLFPTAAAIAASGLSGSGEFRAIEAVVPHDPEKWGSHSGAGIRAGQVVLYAGNKTLTSRVSYDFRDMTNPFVDYFGSATQNIKHQASKNNNSFWRQMNAAGNVYLDLPYLNSQDHFRVVQAMTLNGDISVTGTLGIKALISGVATNVTAGSYLDYVFANNAVTGSVNLITRTAQASDTTKASFVNQTAAGRSGIILQAANGVTYINFRDVTNSKNMGIRMLTTGNLVIDNSYEGAGPSLTAFTVVNTTMQTQFAVAPKLPSSTVAGLPAAATLGAGSLIYVSNESGGACVAFSDGAAWRRVTDLAVVS